MEEKKEEISEEEARNVYLYYSMQLASLSKLRDDVLKQIEEIEETIETIKGIDETKKEKGFFLSIGNSAFSKVKDFEKSFLINIGNEYFQEKTKEEAISILEEKKKNLEKNKEEIESKAMQIQEFLQNLEEALRKAGEKNESS